MMTVTLPEDYFGDGVQVAVALWYFADGETVRAGDVIAEVMSDKVQVEVEAPCSGILRVLKAAEVSVAPGEALAHIE